MTGSKNLFRGENSSFFTLLFGLLLIISYFCKQITDKYNNDETETTNGIAGFVPDGNRTDTT